MNIRILVSLATVMAAFLSGCAQLDVTPDGNPDRVLTGTVNPRATLPAGAQVLVRVIEVSSAEPIRTVGNDLPVAARPRPPAIERVLGEQTQTLAAATSAPVPYRIECRVDDAMLRRGVNIEARISVGGKITHRSVNAQVLTLSASPYPQEIVVDPVQ
ncbi:MAG TPA: hypothetical protein VM029_21325 [Opitutaceae bacterium]|nr:hypothetical protein [Opitutaceae bacterium]